MRKGEVLTSGKGIANVSGEFYKKIYDDNEQEESDNNTNEMTRIPEITTEELRTATNKLKKANPQTATESEQKTSKQLTMRPEQW